MSGLAGAIDYLTFIEYNNWANGQILDTAAKLSDEQLHSGTLSHGSAFLTLQHMLNAEWVWRQACIGTPYNDELWRIEPFADLPSLRAYWEAEGQRLLEFVLSLSEADLERKMKPNWTDELLEIKYILLHIVNHASNHRSELGWYFTACGYSPGEPEFADYMLFFRGK